MRSQAKPPVNRPVPWVPSAVRIVVERHGRGDDEVRAFRSLKSGLTVAGMASSIEKAGHAEITNV